MKIKIKPLISPGKNSKIVHDDKKLEKKMNVTTNYTKRLRLEDYHQEFKTHFIVPKTKAF